MSNVACALLLFLTNICLTKQQNHGGARTFFYEDQQMFFTLQIYFPFTRRDYSYGIPFTSVDKLKPNFKQNVEQQVNDFFRDEWSETMDVANDTNTIVWPYPLLFRNESTLVFDVGYSNLTKIKTRFSAEKRDVSHQETLSHTRTRRALLGVPDAVIQMQFCVAIPYRVPLLKYDEDVLQAYKNKNAREQLEALLPYVPIADDELLNGDDDTEEFTSRILHSQNCLERNVPSPVVETSFVALNGETPLGSKQKWFSLQNVSATNGKNINNCQNVMLETQPMVSVSVDAIQELTRTPKRCRKYVTCTETLRMVRSSFIEALFVYFARNSLPGFQEFPDAVNAALFGSGCDQFSNCL